MVRRVRGHARVGEAGDGTEPGGREERGKEREERKERKGRGKSRVGEEEKEDR